MSHSASPSPRPILALILALAAVLAVQPAKALPISPISSVFFSTNGPVTVGGQEVNVQATFDFYSPDVITVTVLNMEQNPTAVTQLISSVQFTVSNLTPPPPPPPPPPS